MEPRSGSADSDARRTHGDGARRHVHLQAEQPLDQRAGGAASWELPPRSIR
jgi:hypothetical protein